eukprot:5094436-Alexandrium_andersonii.AAC.1
MMRQYSGAREQTAIPPAREDARARPHEGEGQGHREAALESERSVVVLSALGRGAYGDPPAEVAQFFYEALEPVGMETALEEVAFCIFEDLNAG